MKLPIHLSRWAWRPWLSATVIVIGLSLQTEGGRAAELVAFESKTCPYCLEFEAEGAPRYRASPEATRAPLRVVEIEDPLPPDLKDVAPPVGTPTFVLIVRGKEVGRIAGYDPGSFYGALDRLLMRNKVATR